MTKHKTIKAWGVVWIEGPLCWNYVPSSPVSLPVDYAFYKTRTIARAEANLCRKMGISCRVVRVTLPAPEGVK